MKILLINYEYPPLGGGAGNATKNIARELVALGHVVLVLTTWFSGESEDETVDGVRIIRVKSRRRRRDRSSPLEMLDFVIKANARLDEIATTFKPYGCISFFAIPSGLVARKLFQKHGVPYIVSLRGGDVPGFLPRDLWLLHVFSAPLTRLVWRDANRIVANSHNLQELAERTAKRWGKSVDYIPNGVDANTFKPIDMSRGDKFFRVLCSGRLVSQKRIDWLLTACREIIDARPELALHLRCEILGDGPLLEILTVRAATLGLGGIVQFSGWIDRAALPRRYAENDVFVLPSSEEGMPNVVLEAMATGLPIVVANFHGSDELVIHEKNGFIFSESNELAPLLVRLLDDELLRAQFGRESRILATKFNWAKIAAEYAGLL